MGLDSNEIRIAELEKQLAEVQRHLARLSARDAAPRHGPEWMELECTADMLANGNDLDDEDPVDLAIVGVTAHGGSGQQVKSSSLFEMWAGPPSGSGSEWYQPEGAKCLAMFNTRRKVWQIVGWKVCWLPVED